MLDFFGRPDVEAMKRAARSGSLDRLAAARQAFSINPRLAWLYVTAVREIWRLPTLVYPERSPAA